jgi:hypothetical protein
LNEEIVTNNNTANNDCKNILSTSFCNRPKGDPLSSTINTEKRQLQDKATILLSTKTKKYKGAMM